MKGWYNIIRAATERQVTMVRKAKATAAKQKNGKKGASVKAKGVAQAPDDFPEGEDDIDFNVW